MSLQDLLLMAAGLFALFGNRRPSATKEHFAALFACLVLFGLRFAHDIGTGTFTSSIWVAAVDIEVGYCLGFALYREAVQKTSRADTGFNILASAFFAFSSALATLNRPAAGWDGLLLALAIACTGLPLGFASKSEEAIPSRPIGSAAASADSNPNPS